MSIYIDHEFKSTTLKSLLDEAAEVVLGAWFRELENEVLYSYRDLAAEDVRAGRTSPADHPGIPVRWFVSLPFDTTDASTVKLWEEKLSSEVNRISLLGGKVKP